MPTYEYQCDACGHAFEKFQPITAAPVKKCPVCGKSKVRRLISAGGGMIFKGSGFYITDYRSEGYQNAAKADAGATGTGTDGKSDTKSDVKSDGKTDAKSAETKAETKSETKAETKSDSKPAAPSVKTESAPPAKKSEPKASKSAAKK
jgi:putative FmdB family regulatory protein